MEPTRQLVNIMKTELSYNDENKRKFHRIGRKVCQKIADALCLTPGTYDIRSNMGGIAVSGEVTLHAEDIYIQFSNCSISDSFMYRKCGGRKDYCGKGNHWMTYKDLDEYFEQAISTFQIVKKVG